MATTEFSLYLTSKRIFDQDDWSTFYGIKVRWVESQPSMFKLQTIMERDCPFTKGKKVKDTHYLLFIPGKINRKGKPLTLRLLEKFFPKTSRPRFKNYLTPCLADDNQPYADEAIEKDTWLLVFKGIVPHSTNETYTEQLTMLPEGYIVPSAVMMATFHFSIYRKNDGETITESLWGRTSSLNFDGQRIFMSGLFDNELFICAATEDDDHDRHRDTGIYAVMEL